MTSGGLAAVSSSAFAALYSAFGKYDVVHIHAEGPAFFAWLPKMFGKRVVVTVHGIDWQREKWQSGLGSKFIHQGEKNAAKYADEVIVLSKGVQDYFKETYGRETHFIPNGVNRPQIREASLITDKFGLKKDSYIGCKNIISYAASVGQSRLSKILILKGYKLLPIRKLSQIAVRDDKTEKVVKILGKKSVRVLDPTFLYDFPIVKPNDLPRKPYMLIYTYGYNNEEVAAIKNMAKKKGLLTIATGSLCPWADINMVVGSFEWLWLVKNADLIVTGTFHGSVFSIKYNKQFAVLTQGSDKVDSLLSEFGLTDRTATVETIENVLSKDIDYTRVNKIIEEKKERSQNYLLSAVED